MDQTSWRFELNDAVQLLGENLKAAKPAIKGLLNFAAHYSPKSLPLDDVHFLHQVLLLDLPEDVEAILSLNETAASKKMSASLAHQLRNHALAITNNFHTAQPDLKKLLAFAEDYTSDASDCLSSDDLQTLRMVLFDKIFKQVQSIQNVYAKIGSKDDTKR